MKNTCLLAGLLVFLCSSTLFAQQTYKLQKWGKFSEEDLQLSHCDFDSSAAAMVLQEVGSLDLSYEKDGWVVKFNFRTRIKIFDESALDQGNLKIYYRSDRDVEVFKDLDVQIISPAGELQKVKSDNIFTEKVTKTVSAKKVFVPNIQKGSIIEYRYELTSAYIFSLYETWYFQRELPVRWSQVTVTIPQFFTFVHLGQTPRTFDLQENKQESVSSPFGPPYQASVTTYGLSNMPAIKEEPYITTLEDYRAHIGFQLSSVQYPGQMLRHVMTTWADVAETMAKSEEFGEQYLKDRNFDKLWKAFRTEVPETTPKAELPDKVLRFVSGQIKWNGDNRCYTQGSIDAAFSQKSGNSSEINLAVVALLRKLGFDATPLLLSTRDHGRMYDIYPFLEQFNTVVAFLHDGEGGILLDATNPLRPLGQIRGECYNGAAWLVDAKRPHWVNISPPEHSETWFCNMKLSEEGEMSGHMTMVLEGPAATQWRTALEGKKEGEYLKGQVATAFQEITFDSIVFSNRSALDKPLKVDFFCRVPNAASAVNNFLYLKPVLDFYLTSNPLKSLHRKFPVNLTYPIKAQYIMNLELPPGYALEDQIPTARVALPDNAGKMQFSCAKNTEKSLQVILKMNLSQLDFKEEEYGGLRHYFELMAEKVNFQVALKKT